jgi:heme-degrading monooxygenase HmoA
LISRQWRGLARAERADDYVAHLRHETFPQLARISGFVDAAILRRPVERGVEFLIVTRWRSLDAIRQFAGAAAEVAVVPDEVQRMMLDYDRRVAHYEEVYRAAVPSG